jgi:hypothetical protein
MPAGGDCELIGSDFWGQPANAISSLAFLVVGIVLLRSRPVIGWLACGIGVGSFLFHGPMPTGADWAHDVSLAALLSGLVLERRPLLVAGSATAIGLLFALFPTVSDVSTIGLVVLAAGYLIRRRSLLEPRPLTAGLVLAASGTIGALSRSGGPLCHPDSLLQGHALWHLGAALALLIWVGGASPGRRPESRQSSRASTENGPSE